VAATRENKIEVVDLLESNIVIREELPDGSNVYRIDDFGLRARAGRWFVDEKVAGEQVTVVVVNTTGSAGLGGVMSKALETMGVQVVSVENSEEEFLESEVRVNKKEMFDSLMLKKLLRFLDLKKAIKVENNDSRGDVEIFLGKDFKERMRGQR